MQRIGPHFARQLASSAFNNTCLARVEFPIFSVSSRFKRTPLCKVSGVGYESPKSIDGILAEGDDSQKLHSILELVNELPKFNCSQACYVLRLLEANVSTQMSAPMIKRANDALSKIERNSLDAAKMHEGLEDTDVDDRLFRLLKALASSSVGMAETLSIVSTIKAAEHVGLMSQSCGAIRNMENSLTWRARTCTPRDLVMLVSFCAKRTGFPLTAPNVKNDASTAASECTQKLYNEVIRSVERRWVEVSSDAESIVNLLHYCPDIFSDQFARKLEDRATELAETMSGGDLAKVLKILGVKARRTVPLLRAICYHLVRKHVELDIKSASDCLFALRQLAFKDSVDLLECLCNVAEKEVDSVVSAPVIRSLLSSLGRLKFCHEPLLNRLSSWLSDKASDDLKVKDLVAFLLTTATLNYIPRDSEKLYRIVVDRLSEKNILESESSNRSELLWLDVVWSLAVLGKAESHHFRSVLTSDFCSRLLYSHDHRNFAVVLKFLNVNAASALVGENKKGQPVIDVSDDPLLRDVRAPPNPNKEKVMKDVMESFSTLAAPPNYLRMGVNTMMGFNVDGEAVFNSRGQPLPVGPLSVFPTAGNDDQLEKVPLPSGATRVAVMVIGYHDSLISGGSRYSGFTALCVRLLEAQGFSVLTVRYDEFKPQQKKLEKVKLLDQKLKNLLRNAQ